MQENSSPVVGSSFRLHFYYLINCFRRPEKQILRLFVDESPPFRYVILNWFSILMFTDPGKTQSTNLNSSL